jgi:hypothetical protein
MSTITTINDSDLISASNEVINTNFSNLNTDKIETSVLDTDGTLAANSDSKVATQKAVKTYVDTNIDTRTTGTTTSAVSPTINTDTYKRYTLTAQKTDISSFTTNLTGSPSDGDELGLRITNGLSAMSFISSSVYDDAASDTAIVTKPSGTANDDIMFAVIQSTTAYSNSLPSGWTSIAQTTAVSGYYELLYRVASSEGANYTFGFAGSYKIKVTIATYRGGFNISDPIDVFSDTSYITSNTTNRAASMNVTYRNSPLLFFGCVLESSSFTQTKPSLPTTGWVEDYDGGSTNSDFWLEICSMTWAGVGATGDMDSTISSATTEKHAFAVALKPVIEVTYGSKFTSYDETLPTVIPFGETKDIDLEYNSAVSKWVTTGNIPIDPRFTVGQTTYDISTASGTQTIAHGLGRLPNLIDISVTYGASGVGLTRSLYNAVSGFQYSYYNYIDDSTGTDSSSGSTFRISMSASQYQEGVITVDSTNIYIAWTKTSTPTGTAVILWKAE